MGVELYELQFGRKNGQSDSWFNTAEWIKCDGDDKKWLNRHKAAKRVLNLRLRLLISIRKLFKKGIILLDIDQQTFTETVATIEESLFLDDASNEVQQQSFGAAVGDSIFRDYRYKISIFCIFLKMQSILVVKNESRKRSRGHPRKAECLHQLGDFFQTFSTQVCSLMPNVNKAVKSSDATQAKEGAKIFIAVTPTVKQKPQVTFVRLAVGNQFFTNETSARFAIFLVGPPTFEYNYRKLGECLRDMLSNPIFFRIITRAKTQESLLMGIDRLLDHAVVIPPGQLHNVSELNTRRLRRALANDSFEPPRKHGQHQFAQEMSKEHTHPLHLYDPLIRTGKLFNGLISDIKTRYRVYFSDIFDALHYKCFISTILIFFITFATAIGLGEILRAKTEGLMGLSETLVSMCICGVIWGLLSGQPLIIQTKTAAFVIIEGGLFSFCLAHNLNFMIVRVWTGVWVLPITMLMVAFEAPFLIRYVTRFTEEAIDTLISVVLIFESFQFLTETFNDNPLLDIKDHCDPSRLNGSLKNDEDAVNMSYQAVGVKMVKARGHAWGAYEYLGSAESAERNNLSYYTSESGEIIRNGTLETASQEFVLEMHNQPNTALLTLLLMVTTFFISLYLERLKQSSYFSHTVRKAIGNFSIPITIPLMTLAANMLFKNTYIHKLDMPSEFSPTRPHLRGWFINPFDESLNPAFPTWAIFASIFPAFLLTILIFVELELAEHELALKERGLRKGSGFHLDLVLSGFLMLICGFLGVPWLGAGSVESFSHANALTIHRKTLDEEPKVERVIEQRVTTILVALLQGVCAFLGQYLRKIPVAVLMGIFVHLSITNLMLIQFVGRIVLYIVPKKYYPDQIYCQNVSMWRMHLFTTIQVLCFAALFGVEVVAKISILFPLVVGLIALIRVWVLPRIFSDDELKVLDSEGDLDDDEEGYASTTRRHSLNPIL